MQCWLLGILDRARRDFIKIKILGNDRTRNIIISFFLENVDSVPGVGEIERKTIAIATTVTR